MPLDAADLALLQDIRTAAIQIQAFLKGMDKAAFLEDMKTQRAVERDFEIIGEAAGSLSDRARKEFPTIPWKSMVGMRNILIHNYGRVNSDRLYHTATNDLPVLLAKIPGFEVPPKK